MKFVKTDSLITWEFRDTSLDVVCSNHDYVYMYNAKTDWILIGNSLSALMKNESLVWLGIQAQKILSAIKGQCHEIFYPHFFMIVAHLGPLIRA